MEKNEMIFAPVVIFAFNRINSLKACVASLLENSEAGETDLIVFVDGPRIDKEGEIEKVSSVRKYVKGIAGFKSLEYNFSDINMGLGPSVIKGVTGVINQYGKAIVVEDDLIVSKNYLSFMNQGLNIFEKKADVFSICGYTNKIRTPKDYAYDAYVCTRNSSWGWATWKNRWEKIDWNLEKWDDVKRNKHALKKVLGSDSWSLINAWHEGRIKSWAVRFSYNQFIHNAVSIFPTISKVKNNGFDGSGTNCKRYSRFKCEFDESDNKVFSFPSDMSVNKDIFKRVMRYNGIPLRIWSRIMYVLYR